MRNQTHLNYKEGWLGERVFLLPPAKCFAILFEDRRLFLYREILFEVFCQKVKFYTERRWFA